MQPPTSCNPGPGIWHLIQTRHSLHTLYILQGLTNGFHIGFDRSCSLRQSHGNLHSASSNVRVVDDYIQAERDAGQFIGPITHALQKDCHISPIGVIPKPHQPGRWRLIVDLFAPARHSVNDGTDQYICSLQYASIDQAVRTIQTLGKGTHLSKLDLKSAYRMIPIHPDDQPLLCVAWRSAVFLDAALPFGLRSAPKIFSAVANGIAWQCGLKAYPTCCTTWMIFFSWSHPADHARADPIRQQSPRHSQSARHWGYLWHRTRCRVLPPQLSSSASRLTRPGRPSACLPRSCCSCNS